MNANRARFRNKTLFLVTGPAGVGKSSIAKRIVGKVECVYLENNLLADPFYPDTRRSAEYLAVRPMLYAQLYGLAQENLRLGNSVLIDAPFVKQLSDSNWIEFISGLARDCSAELLVLRCHCPVSLQRRRIEARGAERDSWKLAHWDEFISEEPMDIPIPLPHLDLDTSGATHVVVDSLLELLSPYLYS